MASRILYAFMNMHANKNGRKDKKAEENRKTCAHVTKADFVQWILKYI
jgi:hypothetical protein